MVARIMAEFGYCQVFGVLAFCSRSNHIGQVGIAHGLVLFFILGCQYVFAVIKKFRSPSDDRFFPIIWVVMTMTIFPREEVTLVSNIIFWCISRSHSRIFKWRSVIPYPQ